jgi:hypothetical protein
MTDSERQQYAPLGVRAPWSKTTDRLHAKFGWTGVLAWHFMILAAKRSNVPGQLTFGGDADFWTLIGMESDPPEIAVDDLLRELGRMKQTSRTRSGRLSYVLLTRFGDWNQSDRRWREAERKRNKRAANPANPDRTKSGQPADTPRTESGHEADASAPLSSMSRSKEELKDHSLVARGQAEANGAEALDPDDIPFDVPLPALRAMPD